MLPAGTMRHQMAIERPVETTGEYGQVARSWVLVGTVWGAIEPLSGSEIFAARQVQANVTHRVRLRYRAGLTPDMRLTVNGRTLQIGSVVNVGEAGAELELMCTEAAT